MGSDWPSVPLGELVDPTRGISYGIVQPGEHVPDGVPIIRAGDLRGDRIDHEAPLRVARSIESNYSRTRLRGGELVMSIVGTVGQTAIVDDQFVGWNTARAVAVIPVRADIGPYWIRIALRTPAARERISNRLNTTVQATLNLKDVAELPIALPPLPVRQAITSVLCALDNKIELNRQMNETLVATALAIFKDWFVNFGPTRAKLEGRAPYLAPEIWSAFPNRLDDEGKPEGWKVESLGRHTANYDSKRVPVSGAERAKRQGPFPYHGATGVMDHVDDYLFDGVYLLVGEDGSVVKENGRAFTQYVWGKIWVNNHAHVLQGKGSVSTEQLLMYFQHEQVTPYITGAVQLKLSQGRMNSMPFVHAGDEISRKFSEVVAPLFARLRANVDEGKTLALIRDLILPKLMSGEVRVKDAKNVLKGTK